MTPDQAKRILDRVRDGWPVDNFSICEALRMAGDITRWIAKDSQEGVTRRFTSAEERVTK